MILKKDKKLRANILRLLDKKVERGEVPEVFLLALRDWDRGFLQLKRKVFFEMPRLKQRWGFFILLLMLTDYKTGRLLISWKDLVAITGLARVNVYKILGAMDRMGYIGYRPAQNRYRTKIEIEVRRYRQYIFKLEPSSGDKEYLQPNSNRDDKYLQRGGSSNVVSLQEDVTNYNKKGSVSQNKVVVNKTTAPNGADAELLQRQKGILKENEVYREEAVSQIQKLFEERTKVKMDRNLIYGRENSLLQRFLEDKVIKNIKRINWGPKIENPIGFLIRSLEGNYELPISEEEKIEEAKKRREKEEREFKREMEAARKESEKVDYSKVKPLLDGLKKKLGIQA